MNDESQLCEQLTRYLGGDATAEELRELSARLENDPAACDLFAEVLLQGGAIRDLAQADPAPRVAPTLKSPRPLSWRPVTATAAGIVIGILCTSVVMAYMAPSAGKTITLLSDSFEESARQWSHGFPNQAGAWGGDLGEVVSGSGEVQPLEGLHMARLDPSPTATLSYLERVVDLQSLPVPQGNEMRHVAVTASFHAAERGLRDRYTLRVAAFAEAPGQVREQWVGREWREIDGALVMSKRPLSTTADAEGWQTLTALVEIPREARSLVISLASGLVENPNRKTAHYIDGVQAIFSIGPTPAKTKIKRFNLTAK